MSENLFAEKLLYFKQNEKPEVLLLVADNLELIKIIIAWTNTDIRCAKDLTQLENDSGKDTWNWLWDNIIFSISELKEKADICVADYILENKMKPLIGNRIIYPDGTVNSYVHRYLKERVIKLFEVKSKKLVKRD